MAKRQAMLPNPATTPLPQAKARCRHMPAFILALVLVNIGALVSMQSAAGPLEHSHLLTAYQLTLDNNGLPQLSSWRPKFSQALSSNSVERFQQCSIDTFLTTGLPFLKDVHAPNLTEFSARRDRLADALVRDGLDAFVAEPGFTFQYFVNVTQPDWEPWEVRRDE